ncbi:Ribonuclease P/MRP protein subunit POP5 [Fasciola gigantica]|uniref:Ribonuclease P/MRP protein subunit POP5 n=1 Tax=Fasciola gigantica TaxID=46835 RepID=A0A504YF83_FASGI|nr:Ribonuclease P/MRP protein subunit POP5 [Fasciola gigantica]
MYDPCATDLLVPTILVCWFCAALRTQLIPIRAALSMITRIETGGQERLALFDVHHASGTVRGCQKFLVQFYTRQLYSNPCADIRTALLRLVQQRAIAPSPPILMDEM